MSDNKYPYIPKQYFAAVMFACKMVRENGYKNKAIKIAADYYNVDEEQLKKHFEARTAAGRKNAPTKHRKYKYFVVGTFYYCEASGLDELPDKVEVYKGFSTSTVKSRFNDWEYDRRNDTGSAYSPCRATEILTEHGDKSSAEDMCVKLSKAIRNGDLRKYRELTGGA